MCIRDSFETGLVERLGKFNREAKSGLNIVLPGLERIIIVDMREQVIDVPPQEVITKDNVTITVDAVIYYEPTDPKKLVYNVGDFIQEGCMTSATNYGSFKSASYLIFFILLADFSGHFGGFQRILAEL